MSAYGELARYYDGLTRDVDYTQWVAWYQKWFQRSEVPVKIVLDLACGTGTLTCLLAQAGYSMIGTDLSIEMLSEAQEKALELTCEPPVFLHQSMDKLDLFGTIDACVSSLDSLNYVTDEAILRAAFHKIHTFLMPNGCFLFDILAPAHLRSLDGQMFVDETEDTFVSGGRSTIGKTPRSPTAWICSSGTAIAGTERRRNTPNGHGSRSF